jgi:Putative beta-barrel porin-2, OmpL-like. bbp2
MLTSFLIGLTLAVGQTGYGTPFGADKPMPPPDGTTTNVGIAARPASLPTWPDSPPAPSTQTPATNGANGSSNGNGSDSKPPEKVYEGGFFSRFIQAYCDEWNKKDEEPGEPAPRRAPPSPWDSPPFPVSEFQGYPLVGVPPSSDVWPLTKAIWGCGSIGEWLKEERINIYGWVTVSGNFATARESNSPTSYWLVPNRLEMDQTILRFERQEDSVQEDHIDWGFRSSFLYGIDYRYMTAGGYFSDQLLLHNRLYGFDPTEQYFDVYIPKVVDGLIIRVGRWIACPDIETQFAPDNYLGSHSILFTYDTYTQSGFMLTLKLNDQNIIQAGMNAGNDMAPWYKGAVPCGYLGWRWVSKDNKTAFYTVLNQIDDAEFSHDFQNGQPAGHDNFNYIVSTWEQVITKELHTKTEAYFMWERDALVGGTPSLGPVQSFGGGGGAGALIPGWSHAYGYVNYTALEISKKDYITFRNEVWEDDTGFRAGFKGLYTDQTIGISHNFNSLFQVRPEVGYYRNWTTDAFDNGTRKGDWIAGFDVTLRF